MPAASLHDLGDREEGDALAVGQAPAAQDRRRRASPARNSLTSRDFPTPAAPSTVNRWEVRSVTRALERPLEQLELLVAPDERRVEVAVVARRRPP